MKTMLKISGAVLLLGVTGCLAPTQSVIEELDPATGNVIKRTTTSESVVKTVTAATRDKWVLISRQGWAGAIRAVPAGSSAENPAGVLEMVVGKQDELLSTMPFERVTDAQAALVLEKFSTVTGAARSGSLEFSATGVSSK